jgi:glyoxylase-like metal-dependent hydrolase (beta-lactamase superfamily II)
MSLSYTVFTATRPGVSPDVPEGYESLAWVANSATLISGEQDAVLVDTFFTLDHSAELVEQVAASGRNLTHIYVTHAHGDHFFGINTLRRRFPGVRAVAPTSVVDRIDERIASDTQLLRTRFPGQVPDDPGTPERLGGASIELEGHPLIPIEAGYTDSADSTSLHAPSIGLIVAGDVVYNGIHPFLAETTAQTRLEWIAALDRLEALEPRAVVAGHKSPDHDDDPRNVAETRRYLRDFIRLDRATDTPRALFDAMIELYPDRANPGSLWGGAIAAKRESANGPAGAVTTAAHSEER